MSLRMKDKCELCGQALAPNGEAYICSYECTFCKECAETRKHICPNCSGELLQRPRRNATVATS